MLGFGRMLPLNETSLRPGAFLRRRQQRLIKWQCLSTPILVAKCPYELWCIANVFWPPDLRDRAAPTAFIPDCDGIERGRKGKLGLTLEKLFDCHDSDTRITAIKATVRSRR